MWGGRKRAHLYVNSREHIYIHRYVGKFKPTHSQQANTHTHMQSYALACSHHTCIHMSFRHLHTPTFKHAYRHTYVNYINSGVSLGACSYRHIHMLMNIFIWFLGICTYTITHYDVRIPTGTHAHRKIGTSRIECGGEWVLRSVLVVCLRLSSFVSVRVCFLSVWV